MPVKRKAAKGRNRLTPAAVEAFRTGDRRALSDALSLRPWETNPLDITDDEPAAWMIGSTSVGNADDWRDKAAMRRELERQA